MINMEKFHIEMWDYMVFFSYFLILCFIGFWVGRKKRTKAEDYFLAGRSLPWYVVGSSFVASTISSEHFIGTIGAAIIYGICVAMCLWGNIGSFTLLIWFFIPFLLVTRIFTIPEFLEKRFNPFLRQSFAIVTILINIFAFLSAVLYGGGLALQKLFGWNIWFSVIVLGIAAGSLAIWGGLNSVAWADLFTVIVMLVGGFIVTALGLMMLSPNGDSIIEGWKVMFERNQANYGLWKEVMARHAQEMVQCDSYNRLSVIQPPTHVIAPWPALIFGIFSVSIWYNVCNQFIIQRVLGAKNMYHARMGIVFSGFLFVLFPLVVVVPGLIFFAAHPEILNQAWDKLKPQTDQGYVNMLQTLMPAGLRGLFLAALFGAIQSTVQSVLNSTSTIFTLDIYKRHIRPQAGEKETVRVGIWTTIIVLAISLGMAGMIARFSESLFVYIQTLYAFFAPPFAAIFLLGILFKRINGKGAAITVIGGFILAILMKMYVRNWFTEDHINWLENYSMQSITNWGFCVIICVVASLLTKPPSPDKITDDLTVNWKKLNIFSELGDRWYKSVILWWGLFAASILAIIITLSGKFF